MHFTKIVLFYNMLLIPTCITGCIPSIGNIDLFFQRLHRISVKQQNNIIS